MLDNGRSERARSMSLFFSLYDHHYYSYGATKISGDSADLLLLCRPSSTHWAAIFSLSFWAALAIRPSVMSGAATKWNSCWLHTRNILSTFTDRSCCVIKAFPWLFHSDQFFVAIFLETSRLMQRWQHEGYSRSQLFALTYCKTDVSAYLPE